MCGDADSSAGSSGAKHWAPKHLLPQAGPLSDKGNLAQRENPQDLRRISGCGKVAPSLPLVASMGFPGVSVWTQSTCKSSGWRDNPTPPYVHPRPMEDWEVQKTLHLSK